MSSNEGEPDENQLSKKRRVQRACDACRRKKTRCDGDRMPDSRCSNCLLNSIECTYVKTSKKRNPSKSYVERLENRLEKLEALITEIYPDKQILKHLEEALPLDQLLSTPLSVSIHPTQTIPDITTNYIRSYSSSISAKNVPESPVDVDDDNNQVDQLAGELSRLHVQFGHGFKGTFFGKSSSLSLLKSARDARDMYAGIKGGFSVGRFRKEFWSAEPEWERGISNDLKPTYVFPPPDLLDSLIMLYFLNINVCYTLLHRPSFERSVAAGDHHIDNNFADIVLLVCAVASRFSGDERVKVDGTNGWHSAGWKWFNQVKFLQRPSYLPVTLNDLQVCCLHAQFLIGSSTPRRCWTMVGLGIRLAQDVGAHRRKKERSSMTLEDELWKRAFWMLVSMDRVICAGLGRTCAIQDEDFDVDFPIDCDDEYWVPEGDDHRSGLFSNDINNTRLIPKQPPEKPSIVSAYVMFLKLNQILAIVLRTVYSIKKSKARLGFVGPHWEQHIVSELDSALNQWVGCMPDHLRWDPSHKQGPFFKQSTILYCLYYHVQILVHRPFIPTPGKPSTTSFPSLEICTNAARAFSHVIDVLLRREEMVQPDDLIKFASVVPFIVQMAVSTAGFVLLLNIWTKRKSGLTINPTKEIADVHKCMRVLKVCETRWVIAGKIWDFFNELLSAGDLPLPESLPLRSKRERDCESPACHTSPGSQASNDSGNPGCSPSNRIGQRSTFGETHRAIAGSRRVNRKPLPENEWDSLPIYSNELSGIESSAGQRQTYWQPHSWTLPTGISPQGDGPPLRERQISYSTDPSISASQYFVTLDESTANRLAPAADSQIDEYAISTQINPVFVKKQMDFVSRNMQPQAINNAIPVASSYVTSVGRSGILPEYSNGPFTVDDPLLPISMLETDSAIKASSNLNTQMLMDQDIFATLPSVQPNDQFDNWEGYLANMRELAQSFGIGG